MLPLRHIIIKICRHGIKEFTPEYSASVPLFLFRYEISLRITWALRVISPGVAEAGKASHTKEESHEACSRVLSAKCTSRCASRGFFQVINPATGRYKKGYTFGH